MIGFQPYYQPAAWGGRRLADELGRSVPEGPVGESWELVELPERESLVASGEHQGRALGELWRAGVLGGRARGPFPFLLKWLDTTAWLSVQVHPDEEACARRHKGQPKSEAWLIADSAPGSKLLLGHYPGLAPATLRQAATGGTIAKWLYECSPRVGEMVFVPAGTLHAIGPGYLILEVQQPSDTTYRVYDWGRVGLDGKPRALHLDDAVEVTSYARPGAPASTRDHVLGPGFSMRVVHSGALAGSTELRVLVAAHGPVRLVGTGGAQELARGEVVVAEPADGVLELVGGSAVLLGES